MLRFPLVRRLSRRLAFLTLRSLAVSAGPDGRSSNTATAIPCAGRTTHAPCSSIPIWRSRFLAEAVTYAPPVACPGRGERSCCRRTSRSPRPAVRRTAQIAVAT